MTLTVAAASLLGALVVVAPVLGRPSLLLASTAMLLALVAISVWLVRENAGVDWTTSAGSEVRPRGNDHRVTWIARTIDAAITGDVDAQRELRDSVLSVADAQLVRGGHAPLADPGGVHEGDTDHLEEVAAALGPDLTAYLTSPTPRPVSAAQLTSFISTLEEE
ncbi:hypothetical protein V6K52_07560 [Knoellia sp. S7-12]|uniref:hypothetical protein n=1 Tax=Knoellia sp. S7-12 TaxID=3126698 RepID=UPI0033671C2E